MDIGGEGEGGMKSLLIWSVASEIFEVTAKEDSILHDKETFKESRDLELIVLKQFLHFTR